MAAATHEAEAVAVVFVFDTNILHQLEDRDDRRLTFISKSLIELDAGLRAHGSRLIVLLGDPIELIPELVREFRVDAVFAGRDYEPYAIGRDKEVAAAVDLRLEKDVIVFDPEQIATGSGEPFRVFSPFQRCWRGRLDTDRDLIDHQPDFGRLLPCLELQGLGIDLDLGGIGFKENELWLEPGEKAGRRRLAEFMSRVPKYRTARNIPAEKGVSGLSVHLRFGTVSVRDCVRHALKEGSSGGQKWLTELIWRDFYQHILFQFPRVVEEPFQAQFKNLNYPGSEEHWQAWIAGQTGYPIVDAAMRCLNATGFMHNRLRMITASFLSKDLLIDYRRGEAYFARLLLDFELASNNGGWQWASSVGVDPNPWFRIFNPVLQSQKFDPEGLFIKQWVPELAELDPKFIHAPWEAPDFELLQAGVVLGSTYPRPIVDHKEQRAHAIELLRSAKASG